MASGMNGSIFTSATQRATPRLRITLPDNNAANLRITHPSKEQTGKDEAERDLQQMLDGKKGRSRNSSSQSSGISNVTLPEPKFDWPSSDSRQVSPLERPGITSRMSQFDGEFGGKFSEGETWVRPRAPESANQLNEPTLNLPTNKEAKERRAYPEAFNSDDEDYFDEDLDSRLQHSLPKDEIGGWWCIDHSDVSCEPEDDINVDEYWEDVKYGTLTHVDSHDYEKAQEWRENFEHGGLEEDEHRGPGVFDKEALNEKQYAGAISVSCLII